MQYVWTGSWPAVRSPQLSGAWLDGKTARQNIHLASGQTYPAKVQVTDDNQNPLKFVWDILPESTDLKNGGDFESRPKSLDGLVENTGTGEITLKAPPVPGAYRLFAYIFDGQGHAAHVNIPFYVDQEVGAASLAGRQASNKLP
jgi:hypothetical protein